MTARSPRGAASSGMPHCGCPLLPGVGHVDKARPARRLSPAAARRGRWRPFKEGVEEIDEDQKQKKKDDDNKDSRRFSVWELAISMCGLQVRAGGNS